MHKSIVYWLHFWYVGVYQMKFMVAGWDVVDSDMSMVNTLLDELKYNILHHTTLILSSGNSEIHSLFLTIYLQNHQHKVVYYFLINNIHNINISWAYCCIPACNEMFLFSSAISCFTDLIPTWKVFLLKVVWCKIMYKKLIHALQHLYFITCWVQGLSVACKCAGPGLGYTQTQGLYYNFQPPNL